MLEKLKQAYPVEFLITFFIVLAIALILHELGHWIYIYRQKNVKLKPKLFYDSFTHFGLSFEYIGKLNLDQRINLYVFAIASGLVPVILMVLAGGNMAYIFLLPLYMAGCRYDLKQLMSIIKFKTELK